MSGQITNPQQALTFILGGKATVTLVSLASGNRYTYKITKAEKRNPNDSDTWFVKLLNGADNYSNYVYIGMIRNNQFQWTGKSRVSKDAGSFIGFNFCFGKLVAGTINGFEVWHEGKCGRCGRKLTVPESIASGFGPECIGMVGIAATQHAAMVSATVANPKMNFDGSLRSAKKFVEKHDGTPAQGNLLTALQNSVAVPGTPAPVAQNVPDIDAEIRRRINDLKSDNPEMYYQDGMLEEKEAFNVAYNMFRVKIQQEGR